MPCEKEGVWKRDHFGQSPAAQQHQIHFSGHGATHTAKETASHEENKTFLTAPQGLSFIFGTTGVRGKLSLSFETVSLRFCSNALVKKKNLGWLYWASNSSGRGPANWVTIWWFWGPVEVEPSRWGTPKTALKLGCRMWLFWDAERNRQHHPMPSETTGAWD